MNFNGHHLYAPTPRSYNILLGAGEPKGWSIFGIRVIWRTVGHKDISMIDLRRLAVMLKSHPEPLFRLQFFMFSTHHLHLIQQVDMLMWLEISVVLTNKMRTNVYILVHDISPSRKHLSFTLVWHWLNRTALYFRRIDPGQYFILSSCQVKHKHLILTGGKQMLMRCHCLCFCDWFLCRKDGLWSLNICTFGIWFKNRFR